MAYSSKTKDPNARLDYIWPWRAEGWLPATDDITSVEFFVYDEDGNEIDTEVDLTPVVVDDFSFTPDDATAWLMAGTREMVYLIVCRITTQDGRIDDRTLKLRITDK